MAHLCLTGMIYRRGSQSTDDIIDEVFSFDRKSAFTNKSPSVSPESRGTPQSPDNDDIFQYRSSTNKDIFTKVARAPPLALPEVFDDEDDEVTPVQSPVLQHPKTLEPPSVSGTRTTPRVSEIIANTLKEQSSRKSVNGQNGDSIKSSPIIEEGVVPKIASKINAERKEPLRATKQNWISAKKLRDSLSQPVKSYILPQKKSLRNGAVMDKDADHTNAIDEPDCEEPFSGGSLPATRTGPLPKRMKKRPVGQELYKKDTDNGSPEPGYKNLSPRKENPIIVRERIEEPVTPTTAPAMGAGPYRSRSQESPSNGKAPCISSGMNGRDDLERDFTSFRRPLTITRPEGTQDLQLGHPDEGLTLKDASYALLGLSGKKRGKGQSRSPDTAKGLHDAWGDATGISSATEKAFDTCRNCGCRLARPAVAHGNLGWPDTHAHLIDGGGSVHRSRQVDVEHDTSFSGHNGTELSSSPGTDLERAVAELDRAISSINTKLSSPVFQLKRDESLNQSAKSFQRPVEFSKNQANNVSFGDHEEVEANRRKAYTTLGRDSYFLNYGWNENANNNNNGLDSDSYCERCLYLETETEDGKWDRPESEAKKSRMNTQPSRVDSSSESATPNISSQTEDDQLLPCSPSGDIDWNMLEEAGPEEENMDTLPLIDDYSAERSSPQISSQTEDDQLLPCSPSGHIERNLLEEAEPEKDTIEMQPSGDDSSAERSSPQISSQTEDDQLIPCSPSGDIDLNLPEEAGPEEDNREILPVIDDSSSGRSSPHTSSQTEDGQLLPCSPSGDIDWNVLEEAGPEEDNMDTGPLIDDYSAESSTPQISSQTEDDQLLPCSPSGDIGWNLLEEAGPEEENMDTLPLIDDYSAERSSPQISSQTEDDQLLPCSPSGHIERNLLEEAEPEKDAMETQPSRDDSSSGRQVASEDEVDPEINYTKPITNINTMPPQAPEDDEEVVVLDDETSCSSSGTLVITDKEGNHARHHMFSIRSQIRG